MGDDPMARLIGAAVLLLVMGAAMPTWAGDAADCHNYQSGVEPARAAAACRRLADGGNAAAQTNLGWMYRNGHGVTQDDAEAAKWFRKAAIQGDATGELFLATLCA